MKKLITLLCCLYTLAASAQQIDNGGFEHWSMGANGVLMPDSFGHYSLQGHIIPDTDAHSGTYAALIQHTSVNATTKQLEYAYQPPLGARVPWPFSHAPSKLHFWYRFTNPGNTYVHVESFLNNDNGTVAEARFENDVEAVNWTYVEVPFAPGPMAVAPPSSNIRFWVTLSGGMPDTKFWIDDIGLDYITGVEEGLLNNSQSIFPNPAEGHFTITPSQDKPFDLRITDISGKLVHQSKDHSSTAAIDCSTWATGLYLVQIAGGEGVYTEKLYISH